jgi:7,8-dihydroneopterin aldolase/epimerase/oxygenase
MADRIELRNVRAWGKHGCTPGERESAQPFDINLVLEIDLSASQKSDELSDTVDYALVYGQVVKIVSDTSFNLLERLASEILSAILAHKRVQAAQISIAKPGLLDGATAIVILERVNTTA